MNDPKISGIAALNLKDPSLFRQQCYIDGKWADADGGKSIPVNNPATGEILGTVPNMGAAETRRAIEAANAALPAWRAKTAKERANILRKWFDLMMANQEDLAQILTAEQGKPLAEARDRDLLRRLLHRVVRRGSQAHLRRYHSRTPGRQAHRRAQGADRRVRGDHAVEFPQRHDHAQVRPGARGGLHHGAQARDDDALLGARHGRAGASAPASRRASSAS
mgnify:CR=1 FL=1